MDWIAFTIYRYCLLPVVFFLARTLSIFNLNTKFFDSLRFRLKTEFIFKSSFDKNRKSIGFHAASGEIEYALPLIRKIKELHPDYNIVVTLSSASVLKSVIAQSDVDAVGPAPLDLFWRVETFLKRFHFKLFLFARTDVWPEFSWQLEKLKIPAILFSATFSKKSADKSNIENSLTRWSLNLLSQIYTVSDEDRDNLRSIQVRSPIVSLGDTRFDQVFHKKIAITKKIPNRSFDKNIFVAGSTWPEDEAVLLPVIPKTRDLWRFVIAPHEIDEAGLQKLEAYFLEHGLKSKRFSKIQNDLETGIDWDVVLVDLYGYLFHLYSWANIAFVGGSFKSKVHSVMEPLSFFKPVCVGPYHLNNREALEFSQILAEKAPVTWVSKIENSEELVELLQKLANTSSTEKLKMEEELGALMSAHQGATSRSYELIKSYL